MSKPKTYQNRYPFSSGLYVKPSLDGLYDDGYEHERDESGWCKNCDAPPGCSHARLVPRVRFEKTDEP